MNINTSPSPKMAQRILAENFSGASETLIAPLAETIVRLGRMSAEDAARVEDARNKTQMPFGRTAVRMGLLSKADLQYALGVQLGFLHETNNPVIIPQLLAVANNPYSKTAEQFRSMRTHLLAGRDPKDLNLFAITDADERCGADFIAANLAASFTQLGKRVALVDARLRKPTLGKIFAADASEGVSNFVAGGASVENVVHPTLIKNLDLTPAGVSVADAQTILASQRFSSLLNALRNNYEIVIVLSPAFGESTDVEFVWAAAEKAIIVVRKDHSRVDTLRSIEKAARRSGGLIIGATFTN
ncbi:MAG: AAA family ATPase [Marinicaulis sp.]|nr:AAA family ATPase [Marinicaulis sp.]NNL90179.1 AAA family ATPase [Marinicaulis sp.]